MPPQEKTPLSRLTPKRSVQWLFWGLRLYILGMILIVLTHWIRGH